MYIPGLYQVYIYIYLTIIVGISLRPIKNKTLLLVREWVGKSVLLKHFYAPFDTVGLETYTCTHTLAKTHTRTQTHTHTHKRVRGGMTPVDTRRVPTAVLLFLTYVGKQWLTRVALVVANEKFHRRRRKIGYSIGRENYMWSRLASVFTFNRNRSDNGGRKTCSTYLSGACALSARVFRNRSVPQRKLRKYHGKSSDTHVFRAYCDM